MKLTVTGLLSTNFTENSYKPRNKHIFSVSKKPRRRVTFSIAEHQRPSAGTNYSAFDRHYAECVGNKKSRAHRAFMLYRQSI